MRALMSALMSADGRMADAGRRSVLPARQVTRIDWASTVLDGDAVIVREETPAGRWFMVHTCRGPQLACRTYGEAETRTLAYAARARAHAWYTDGRGLQLLDAGDCPVSLCMYCRVDVTSGRTSPSTGKRTHDR